VSVRDSCFARMMTRRKRLCVSNTCLPHEISMEKAFANCSYGNAAHDDEGIETLGIVYLVRGFSDPLFLLLSFCFLPKITGVLYIHESKKKKNTSGMQGEILFFFSSEFLKCFFEYFFKKYF